MLLSLAMAMEASGDVNLDQSRLVPMAPTLLTGLNTLYNHFISVEVRKGHTAHV